MDVPVPQEDALVLSITGVIGASVDFDMLTLEKFDMIEYETYDTSLHRWVNYRGIVLRDVLAQVGGDLSRSDLCLRASAFDDYQTDISINVLTIIASSQIRKSRYCT